MPTNTSGGTTTSLNNTPQARDDFFAVQEDAIVYFDVMANDLGGNAKILWSIDNTSDDGSGDLVSKDVAAVAEYSELGASISLTSDGKIRYDGSALDQLAAGETATDQFTYAIRLANGTLSWATVTVTITGVNDAPVAADDTGAGNEDSLISGSVATNDSDVDNGAVLSYAINGAAPAGFAMDGDGNWTLDASDPAYQHLAAGATTDVVVSYTVTDEHGATDTATLTITVTGINDAPEAADDLGAGNEDALIVGSVAANDDDVDDAATLSYAINGGAPAGFSMDGDGNWTLDASDPVYQHLAAGATTDVVVSYTVTDEHGATDTATLTITVTGVNDAPEAVDDVGDGSEDGLIVGSVATNDDDVDDGATLGYAINDAAPAGFSMDGDGNWALDASDPAYQHLAAGATTEVVVSYTVTDEHGASDTATLTITVTGVNDAPEAADDASSGNEDSLISGSVAANDDDVDDGAALSYAINGAAPAGFSMDGDGNWTLDASDPAYQHLAAGATTDVVVSYTVTDEHGATDTATLTITVTGANDAPEAADDLGDGNEDALIAGSVATNDDDVDDGATLSYAINGAAPAGFSMDGDGNWALDASDPAYQHLAAGATTDVVVSYTVTDEHGATDTATLTITVTGVNDAPEAADDLGDGSEDALISGSVAANDDDIDDGATLSYAINGPAPAGFSMDDDGNWTLDASDPAYQHLAAGATTEVVVSYTVTDEYGASDTATLTVTVTGVNDAPEAANDAATGDEDLLLLGSVAGNDDDADDGAILSYAINGAAPAGFAMDGDGNWTLDASDPAYQQLAAGQSMNVVVSYTVTDEHGASDTATLTVTVNGVNDAPVAVGDEAAVAQDDSVSGSVAANDSDADDGAVLGYALVNPAPIGLTFNSDGSWSFDASSYDSLAEGEELVLTIPYTVADEHGASDGAALTIMVTGANDPASISAEPGGDYDVIEAGGVDNGDSVDWSASGQVTVTDADAGEAVFQAPPSLDGTYGTFGFDSATGQWTYDLDNGREATEALNVGDVVTDTLTVTSADGTATYDIVVTITGTNDAAVISGTTTGTVAEATSSDPGTPTVTGELFAEDVDNAPNSFIPVTSPTASTNGYGTFTMTAAGVWMYTLNNNHPDVDALTTSGSLTDSFIVESEDGTSQTITVTINGADDEIVITPPPTFDGADPNDFDTAGPAAGATVTVTSSSGTDTWNGTNGADTINAGSGSDNVYGHNGNDTLNGENGQDVSLYGQAGDDVVTGGAGSDQIYGGSGADTLYGLEPPAGSIGGDGGDTIYGGSGNDTIYGQGANDIIIGGYGADLLTGGAGIDFFRYLSVLDTNDTILDFGGTDRIDMSAIDADPFLAGNQAFDWGGMAPTPYSLWFEYDAGTNTTTLFGDTNGDPGTAEFMLTLQNFNGWLPYGGSTTPPPDIIF